SATATWTDEAGRPGPDRHLGRRPVVGARPAGEGRAQRGPPARAAGPVRGVRRPPDLRGDLGDGHAGRERGRAARAGPLWPLRDRDPPPSLVLASLPAGGPRRAHLSAQPPSRAARA